MSQAYRRCRDDGNSPDLSALRELLLRLEPPDCSCPPYLSCPCGQECPEGVRDTCRHCREECDCPPCEYQPPCRHVAAAADPSDLFRAAEWYVLLFPISRCRDIDDQIAALAARAWPDDYYDPPRPLPDIHATSREARVDKMSEREANNLHISHPLDGWRKDVRGLGVQAKRLRNGAVAEEGVKRA